MPDEPKDGPAFPDDQPTTPDEPGLTPDQVGFYGKGAIPQDNFTPKDLNEFGKGAIPVNRALGIPRFGDYVGSLIPFDWNKGVDHSVKIPFTVNDQGSSSSCTFQAWSKYVAGLNFLETGKYTDFSARFGYARTWIPPEGGAWLFSGGDLVVLAGVPLESTVPSYDVSGKPLSEEAMRVRDDLAATLREAKTYRTKQSVSVTASIDEMAVAIRDQGGMVFGFQGSNEGAATGGTGIIRPPKAGEQKWGHGVYAVGAGLIDGKKHIKFLNSWSNKWGQYGYGYIGEDYFLSGDLFDGITLIDLPNVPAVAPFKALEGETGIWIVADGKKTMVSDNLTYALISDRTDLGKIPQIDLDKILDSGYVLTAVKKTQ